MAKSLREMGWRKPVGPAKTTSVQLLGDKLTVNGKQWTVSMNEEDFEDLCGEFGVETIEPVRGAEVKGWKAEFPQDPTAAITEAFGEPLVERKARIRKAIKENEDELINDAANVPAPAPAPVPVPQAAPAPVPVADPAAQPGPMNPLVPPQPGMIPTGWMFPNQSAQAVAMDTGDANLAAAAPGGGVVNNEPVTNEEAEMIQEYRKYKRAKKLEGLAARLASRVKENSEEELEPVMPEDPELELPPEQDVNAEAIGDGVEASLDDEGFEAEAEAEADDEADVDLDDLEDVVIDINKLFADAGGDLAAVTSPDVLDAHEETEEHAEAEDIAEAANEVNAEEEEVEEEPVQESTRRRENRIADVLGEDEYINAVDDLEWDPEEESSDEPLIADDDGFNDDEFEEEDIIEDMDPGNAIQDYGIVEKKAKSKRSWREAALPANAVNIKFPAGTPAPKVSSAAIDAAYDVPNGSAIQALEKRTAARRAVLAELRRRNRKAEGLADADLSDADKPVNAVVDEIIPGSNKAALLDESAKGPAAKFLETYREKQKLDYRAMLEQGLLG